MKNIKLICLVTIGLCGTVSCVNDLNRQPFYDITSTTVYSNFANYKEVLAKLYAGYAVSGQQGPSGNPDIAGIDEGFSQYVREYYNAQELPTDEAVIAWNDGTLPEYHLMTWSSSNEFVRAMYDRIYYQVSLCNEFLRETTDAKLAGYGITGDNLTLAKNYRAEARFLRALSYWHALDLYGNVPFVTENDAVGSTPPKQILRKDLFTYIESELKALETGDLVDARKNEYGRADKACAWMLLSKLYLNAEVYTGTARYTDAVTYCSKIIGAGFTLDPKYANLFLADNNKSPEIIFPIESNGLKTQTWGSMTYLIHAPVGGSMNPAAFGINGGWGGLRVTKQFVNLFSDTTGKTDQRAMFYTNGQNLEINNIFTFTDGYPITKYKNITSTGAVGSDPTGNFPDTDFPMFRLADVYLMYAEAVLRGGTGGSTTTALQYVNQIRQRAYGGGTSGNIGTSDLTLDFILAERARELSWECHRRTDLIRFGKFTGSSYLWAWKGNVQAGQAVADFRNLMPIPSSDLTANPNLVQNPGY